VCLYKKLNNTAFSVLKKAPLSADIKSIVFNSIVYNFLDVFLKLSMSRKVVQIQMSESSPVFVMYVLWPTESSLTDLH